MSIAMPRIFKRPTKKQTMTRTPLYSVLESPIFLISVGLMLFGLAMVVSSSTAIAEQRFGNPLHYLSKHGFFCMIALIAGGIALRINVEFWQRIGPVIFILGIPLLILVFVPGFGREINGANRWIGLNGVNFQPSELMKWATVLYISGYLVRHIEKIKERFAAFLVPLALVGAVGGLILIEPDMGAVVTIMVVTIAMLFLAGVKFWHFTLFVFTGIGGVALTLLFGSAYRMQRVKSMFSDVWLNPYGENYQTAQALIAFGRGDITGAGLGASVQKLFYLPEAHTDFLFAVIAEELGLIGTLSVIAVFSVLVWKIFKLAKRAQKCEMQFATHYAHGIAVWIAFQSFINIAVNMRILPTKGITLPFISYGGSSMFIMSVAVAILLRIEYEVGFKEDEFRVMGDSK